VRAGTVTRRLGDDQERTVSQTRPRPAGLGRLTRGSLPLLIATTLVVALTGPASAAVADASGGHCQHASDYSWDADGRRLICLPDPGFTGLFWFALSARVRPGPPSPVFPAADEVGPQVCPIALPPPLTPPPPAPPAPAPGATGYWMLDGGGSVHAFGAAYAPTSDTQVPSLATTASYYGYGVADIETTARGAGFWVLLETGCVVAVGDAGRLGTMSKGQLRPWEKAVALSATPSGLGYWITTDQGRVFAFGDAVDHGDLDGVPLNGPIVASVATPGSGYYLVASDGGIFSFGDAAFRGSMGGERLNRPVNGLVPDPDGVGYWLVADDGGVFAFDADFRGSMGGAPLNRPVVGMVAYGDGYLMVGADGGIFSFSDLPFHGSLGDHPLSSPIVSVAALDI
jgi:hypothetical protein